MRETVHGHRDLQKSIRYKSSFINIPTASTMSTTEEFQFTLPNTRLFNYEGMKAHPNGPALPQYGMHRSCYWP
jgi:hypothetical protein